MKSLALFLFVIATLFGPKLGFVDLSFFLGATIAFFLAFIENTEKKTEKDLFINAILFLPYLIYILGVQIYVGVDSPELILRTLRAFSILIIFLLCAKVIVKHGRLIMPMVMLSVTAHALFIIAASFNIELNQFLGAIFGNDRIRPLRSSGLVSGFDVAGFFCIAGLLAVVTNAYEPKSEIAKYFLSLLFLTACYFSSRVSMVLAALLFVILIARSLFIKNVRLSQKIIAFIVLAPIAGFMLQEILIIFEVAFTLGIITIDNYTSQRVVERFATATIEDGGLISMYFLPASYLQLFFGAGTDTLNSDVGYVKFLFWHGIFGFFLMICIIGHLLFKSIKNLRTGPQAKRERVFIICIYFMVFLMTLKNNYLLTRGIWSLLILLHLHSCWRSRIEAQKYNGNTTNNLKNGIVVKHSFRA